MAFHQHRADDVHGAASKQDVTDAEARLLGTVKELRREFDELRARLWDHHHEDGVISDA